MGNERFQVCPFFLGLWYLREWTADILIVIRYLRKVKDVMKMTAPGSNLGGSATPLGGAAAAVGDGWGRGWGVLGNKVS
jgi:hypothetical protein